MAMVLVQCLILLCSCPFSLLCSSYADAHSPIWLLSPSSSRKFGYGPRASKIQFQFSRTCSSWSRRKLMISDLEWNTWINEQRKLNLFSRLYFVPCILQTRASMPPHLLGRLLFQNSRGMMSMEWLEEHRWSSTSTKPSMEHTRRKLRACMPTRHHDSGHAYRCLHA
jgi:hypothetical protein